MERIFIVEYDNREPYEDRQHYAVTTFRKEADAQRFIDEFTKLDIRVNEIIDKAIYDDKLPQPEYNKLFDYYYEKYYKVYDLNIGYVQNSLFYYKKVLH